MYVSISKQVCDKIMHSFTQYKLVISYKSQTWCQVWLRIFFIQIHVYEGKTKIILTRFVGKFYAY